MYIVAVNGYDLLAYLEIGELDVSILVFLFRVLMLLVFFLARGTCCRMSFRYVLRRQSLRTASAGAGVFDDLSVPTGSDATEQYSFVCDPRLSSIPQKVTLGLASSIVFRSI